MRKSRAMLVRLVALPAIGLLVLSSCSSRDDGPAAKTKSLIVEAQTLKPEQIEAKANEVSQNDYRMFRSLMAAGGLDEALGGAAQGDAALRALMMQFRQQMLGAQADLPRLIKIQGSSDAPGFTGLGASFFIGLVTTGALVTVSGAGQVANGTYGGDRDDGSFQGTFDQQQVTSSSTFTGEIMGMKGKVTTKMTLDVCPKADGAITIDLLSDSSLTTVGGTASANVKVTGKATWYVNDDAEFGADMTTDIRVENATFGGKQGRNGSFVDYSEQSSTLAAGTNAGVVNRASSKATKDDLSTAQAAVQMARLLLLMSAYKAKDAFQSGQCVTLNPTSDPAKRNGVKPSTSFAILAAPRSKIDGMPTKGSVKTDLTGDGKLDPAGTKVPADAKFTYVAPDAKDKKGSIAFEARSKRGIGKATLAFDTINRAYSAVGGSANGQLRGSGNICSLSAPFVLTGSGVTQNFTPSSETGGSYSYSGAIAGIRVYGKGTYTVNADENGGTLTATGPGSVVTPMGVYTDSDTETYKLTPISECRN